MQFSTDYTSRKEEVADLFAQTFADSEGEEEGAVIRALTMDLLDSLGPDDIDVFLAEIQGRLVGGIIFARMDYSQDARRIVLLGPVAVATDQQGTGVGQRLLKHGLEALQKAGVDVVLCYGNVKYYAKVGFAQISQQDAHPPHALKHPHGWLGLALNGSAFAPLKGKPICLAPWDHPDLW